MCVCVYERKERKKIKKLEELDRLFEKCSYEKRSLKMRVLGVPFLKDLIMNLKSKGGKMTLNSKCILFS